MIPCAITTDFFIFCAQGSTSSNVSKGRRLRQARLKVLWISLANQVSPLLLIKNDDSMMHTSLSIACISRRTSNRLYVHKPELIYIYIYGQRYCCMALPLLLRPLSLVLGHPRTVFTGIHHVQCLLGGCILVLWTFFIESIVLSGQCSGRNSSRSRFG